MSGENALTWGKVSITNKHGLKATLTSMRTNTLLLVLKKTCIIARMTIEHDWLSANYRNKQLQYYKKY